MDKKSDYHKKVQGLIDEVNSESNVSLQEKAQSKNNVTSNNDTENIDEKTAVNTIDNKAADTTFEAAADIYFDTSSLIYSKKRQLYEVPPIKDGKNMHEGHRKRVKSAADTDPEFSTFSDHEILEYLLFNTIPRVDTNVLAHNLIEIFGSFSGVLNATVNELVKVPYINETTARMLNSIIPAARKAENSRLRHNVFLDSTLSAVNYMQSFFQNRNREVVYLACLDHNDRLISTDLIAYGDTSYATFDIKKIIEAACRHSAEKIILAHNHPAGTIVPSTSDKEVTTKLMVSLLSMGILLVDHIIFSTNGYYSFFANREFESMYEKIDSIFNSNLVQEIRERKTKYKKGKYIFEGDE